jgi:hypothetical protein
MSIENEADDFFEGPVDEWGRPKVGNEPLDVEVRFRKEGPTLYRWFWESSDRQPYAGPWRESREQAYNEGHQWLTAGRL